MEENKNWRFAAVGNIVKQHTDETGKLRYGTAAYVGGTKVYLFAMDWSFDYDTIATIGLNRFHHYQINSVPVELIENVRFQRVYKPSVLEILDREEFFEGWVQWKRTAADRRAAEQFVRQWNNLMRNTIDEPNPVLP